MQQMFVSHSSDIRVTLLVVQLHHLRSPRGGEGCGKYLHPHSSGTHGLACRGGWSIHAPSDLGNPQ